MPKIVRPALLSLWFAAGFFIGYFGSETIYRLGSSLFTNLSTGLHRRGITFRFEYNVPLPSITIEVQGPVSHSPPIPPRQPNPYQYIYTAPSQIITDQEQGVVFRALYVEANDPKIVIHVLRSFDSVVR